MVRMYEVRGTELGGDAFYEDWVEVIRYEDYAKLEAELQKYKDQFPDYVECANCGSVTHVEGAKGTMGQSGCQIGEHDWVLDVDEDYFVCRSCGEMT